MCDHGTLLHFMEHVKKHFLCKYLVRYTVGWGKRLPFQICACFYRGTKGRRARGRQSVKNGEIFAENSRFQDVDGPFLELRNFSFFSRIRLVEMHLMGLVEVDLL